MAPGKKAERERKRRDDMEKEGIRKGVVWKGKGIGRKWNCLVLG